MSILDRLYRANAKDIASGSSNIRRYIELVDTGSTVAAALSITTTIPCPPDTVRLLTQVSIVFAPGAAQSAISAGLQGFADGAPGVSWMIAGATPVQGIIANNTTTTIGGIEFLVFPGELFQLGGTFNAGVAANRIVVTVHGFEFPRGSLQR